MQGPVELLIFVLSLAGEKIDSVCEHGFDNGEAFAHGFRRTGQIDDQCPAANAATPREIIAIGVTFNDSARIASAIPGASRSITFDVASGVLSRGPSPVPPVVTIKFTSPRSHDLSQRLHQWRKIVR